MRRIMIVTLLSAGLLMPAAAAFAGYGAFALDTAAKKFGYSLNQTDQRRANDLALKNCKSDKCKVVFPLGPRLCGALATGTSGTAWGGAAKRTRDAAKLAAIEDCQKRTGGQCKLRAVGCNR